MDSFFLVAYKQKKSRYGWMALLIIFISQSDGDEASGKDMSGS